MTDPTLSSPPSATRPRAPRLFLVDGYALIYRAFFALISRPLTTARGENTSVSDVDLLIDVTGDTTPWFPGSLVADLEQLLGQRVQVVIRRSLSPLIRDAVLREAVPL